MTEQSRDRIAAAFERELAASPVPLMLRVDAVGLAVQSRHYQDQQRQPWALALVAALLALAVVATLVLGARSLHPKAFTPANPGPTPGASRAACNNLVQAVPMKMVSPTIGWAQGPRRTTDAGADWRDVPPPSLPNRSGGDAEFFLDSTHAWTVQSVSSATSCAGQFVTFVTTTGGATWQRSAPVTLDFPAGWDIAGQLFFINAQQGWLLVGSGPDPGRFSLQAMTSTEAVLYATTDSGLHWTVVSRWGSAAKTSGSNSCSNYLLAVTFVSPTTGWGETCSPDAPALLVTHDGGVTWTAQHLPSALVNGCPGVPSSNSPTVSCELPLPVFFNDRQGILLGDNVLLATLDGGSTWVERSLPPRITSCCGDAVWTYFQVDFLDANNGWAIAPPPGWTKGSPVKDWLYTTEDGGLTWTLVQQDLPLGYPVTALQVVDLNNAFASGSPNAVGSGDELVKTTDGGHTWKLVNAQTQGT